MNEAPFQKLTSLLKHLERGHIHYTLASHRPDALMVLVTVPGERWEIEFLGDATVEVERFLSNEEIAGEEMLPTLLSQFADYESAKVV